MNPYRRHKPQTEQKPTYAEGDIASNARGTTARANGGKAQLHLVPLHLLAGVARVLAIGVAKYAPWNWAKGGKWSTAYDSLLRHLFAWWAGEELDAETGQHHLDHALANLLFLIHYRDTFPAGDDRPIQSVTHFNASLPYLAAEPAQENDVSETLDSLNSKPCS